MNKENRRLCLYLLYLALIAVVIGLVDVLITIVFVAPLHQIVLFSLLLVAVAAFLYLIVGAMVGETGFM